MTKQHLSMLLALAVLAGCSAQDKPAAPPTAKPPASTAPVAVIVDVPASPAPVVPPAPRVVAPKPKVQKQGNAMPELTPQEFAALKARLSAPGR